MLFRSILPVSICDMLQRMMNSFWWGSQLGDKRRIYWYNWDRLCVRKEFGGLGFRNFHSINLAMLGKHGWNIISNPDALACRVLKAKYFISDDLFSTQLGSNPSHVWKRIWSSIPTLVEACRWRIRDGH